MLATSLHLRLKTGGFPEADLAKKLLDGIEQTKVDMRALGKGLIPVEVDENGLMAALAELADDTEQDFELRCRFECDSEVKVTDNFVATRLFRIAREAVHNAVKHGKPKEIVIRLRDETSLQLEVQDDGIGISNQQTKRDGNGIRIMLYRAGLIGGDLKIQNAKDGGTRVTCHVDKHLICDL